jgi:cellobiose phosphorylase
MGYFEICFCSSAILEFCSCRREEKVGGYLLRVRKNSGQHSHAAIWAAVSRRLMGGGERAYQLFEMLIPINHALVLEAGRRCYIIDPCLI